MSNARHFGAGVMIATPSTANPTPVEFGVLQDVTVDFSFSAKPLVGQYQMPVAVARGAGKISGKAKFAELNGPVFSTIFFQSVTPVAGQDMWSYNEAGSIPATPGPYTVAVAQSATWATDLGVKFASTGLPLTRVAAAPAAGQYSVAAGTYSFAAADQGKAVLISYQYTQTGAGSGSRVTITNPLLGAAPTFQIDFYQTNPNVSGAQWSFRLYACMSSKLAIATKLEDWNIPEFDFEAFANAANQIGTWNTAV